MKAKKLFTLSVIAILSACLFLLPVYGGELRADFNGDGKVDSDDAVYLLYHVYFPEQYPVHEIADPDHECGTPAPGGKICVTCGQSLPAEHIHTEVIDPAVTPTCTEDGVSEGKHCSVCGEVITAQITVPATGHTEVIDKAIEPTCTENGKTEGKHCSVCNVTIVAQTTVAVKEHTFISGYSVNATCKDEGKIVGSVCSSCGFEQEITYIAPTGHTIINNSCSQCNASKYMKIFEWFSDANGNARIDREDEFVWPYDDLKKLEV
ncbi:MAG: hypothetical protein IKV54_05275, partial [Clostridia bacterium]|nr:hypothetical protein [Clostridia bacterium]